MAKRKVHCHNSDNNATLCLKTKTDKLLLTTKPDEVTCDACWKAPTMSAYGKRVVEGYLEGLKNRLDSNKELSEVKKKLTAMCGPQTIK